MSILNCWQVLHLAERRKAKECQLTSVYLDPHRGEMNAAVCVRRTCMREHKKIFTARLMHANFIQLQSNE